MIRWYRHSRKPGKRWWQWLLLGAVLISPPLSAQGAPEINRPRWSHSLEEALHRSSLSMRPILVFVEDSI